MGHLSKLLMYFKTACSSCDSSGKSNSGHHPRCSRTVKMTCSAINMSLYHNLFLFFWHARSTFLYIFRTILVICCAAQQQTCGMSYQEKSVTALYLGGLGLGPCYCVCWCLVWDKLLPMKSMISVNIGDARYYMVKDNGSHTGNLPGACIIFWCLYLFSTNSKWAGSFIARFHLLYFPI